MKKRKMTIFMRVRIGKSQPKDIPLQIGVSVFENFREFPWMTIAKFGIGRTGKKIDFSTDFESLLPWEKLSSAEQFYSGDTSAWIDISESIYSRLCERPDKPASQKTIAVCFNSPSLPCLTGHAPCPNPRRIGFKPDCGNLEGINAVVDFAEEASEDHIIFSSDYSSDISLIALDISGIFDKNGNRQLKDFDFIRPVYESVCEQFEQARKLGVNNTSLCRKIILNTWIHHGYMFNLYDSKTAQKQLEWLRLVGYNYCNWFITLPPGISGETMPDGMSCYTWVSPETPAWLMPDPWKEYLTKEIESKISFYVDKWKKEIKYKEGASIWCKVGDEIKLIAEDMICELPQSQNAFKAWLKTEGITHDDKIVPIRKKDVEDEFSAKIYYYTCWYRQLVTIKWWERYIEELRKVLGAEARIGMESCGISFNEWPDYYLMSQSGFMDHMLHEYTTKLWIPNHYAIAIAEKHRSVEKFGKEQAGALFSPSRTGTAAGNELICMTALMRGFKHIHMYDYYHNEPWLWELYSSVAKFFERAANVEDFIFEGKSPVDEAECAVLFSRSTEIWGGAGYDNYEYGHLASGYLMERNTLIAALAFQQIPLDILPEEEISKRLEHYKVLYISDANLTEKSQDVIIEWVKTGGVLFTVAGAAVRDEFNQPSSIWDKLSLRKNAIKSTIERPDAYSEYTAELYDLPVVDHINWQDGAKNSFEVFIGRDIIDIPEALSYGTFENEDSAAIALKVGKGWGMHLAFLPAVTLARQNSESYLHDIKNSKNGRRQHDQRHFNTGLLSIYAKPISLAKLKHRLTVSKTGVDATFYEQGDKAIIMLADYDSPILEYIDLKIDFCSDYSICKDEHNNDYGLTKDIEGITLIKNIALENTQMLFCRK
jgi:hypothetical protein